MGRYQDALDYIFGYVNYEKKARYPYDAATFDLTRMEQVLDLLGRPHEKFRSVHIAGTKGKGSTSAMVESMLRAAGYRTGLFTSPHLHSFRERIRVGTRADEQGRSGRPARPLPARASKPRPASPRSR